jgi:hypothetical protein
MKHNIDILNKAIDIQFNVLKNLVTNGEILQYYQYKLFIKY